MSKTILKKSLAVLAGLFAFNALVNASDSSTCGPVKLERHVKVDALYDGRTFAVGGAILSVNAIHVPVLSQYSAQSQPMAKQVAESVDELLEQYKGYIDIELDIQQTHRGRVLAHVFLEDGQNLAHYLVSNGLALVNTQLPNTRYSACYREAEKKARAEKVGLWQFEQFDVPVIEASRLTRDREGFQIVRGKVNKVEQKSRYVYLELDRVQVRIGQHQLKQFDLEALMALTGKVVEIRDHFTFFRHHMVASLEHPGQIDLLADAFYNTLSLPKTSTD